MRTLGFGVLGLWVVRGCPTSPALERNAAFFLLGHTAADSDGRWNMEYAATPSC